MYGFKKFLKKILILIFTFQFVGFVSLDYMDSPGKECGTHNAKPNKSCCDCSMNMNEMEQNCRGQVELTSKLSLSACTCLISKTLETRNFTISEKRNDTLTGFSVLLLPDLQTNFQHASSNELVITSLPQKFSSKFIVNSALLI